MRMIRTRAGSALLLLGLVGMLAGVALAADFPDPKAIPVPPLGKIQVPTPERVVLDNGMIVYLLEDHDFPLVDARALMRIGEMYDPASKVGLAEITGEVMRTGGSLSTPGDSLDRMLESMGASVEINVTSTEGRATVSTLSANSTQGIEILADLLRNPAFPAEKIDLAKTRMNTEIASRNDEMFDILSRELGKLIYGADHPYARQTEYATVEAISRDDMVTFHHRYVTPDRTILAVYGDFDSDAMKRQLAHAFGDWARSRTGLPEDPAIPDRPVTGLYLANKGDATNSAVVMGQIGVRRDDPDYPALALLSEVVGGGFSSRLFNEIRTRRGLAYATGSSPGAGYHHPGAMIFYAITQTDSTAATARYIRREVDKVLAQPVSQAELDLARESILNGMIFDLSSKSDVLYRLAQYEFYGYPPDFLQTFQEKIRALTPQDLLAAAQRKIHPDDFATLVVGKKDAVLPGLSDLGAVKEIDISIPPPPGSDLPEATEADYQKAQELLARAVKSMGGAALTSVKDITWTEEGKFRAAGMEMNATIKTTCLYPDCVRWDQTLPMATIRQAVCGDSGWREVPGAGILEMKPEDMGQANSYRARDMISLLQRAPSLKAQALPDEVSINGRPADVVAVRDDRVQGLRIYFDRQTGLISRIEFRDRASVSGPVGTIREDFTDYGPVGRIQWPHARKRTMDDQPLGEFKTTEAAVNTGVGPEEFGRPSN